MSHVYLNSKTHSNLRILLVLCPTSIIHMLHVNYPMDKYLDYDIWTLDACWSS